MKKWCLLFLLFSMPLLAEPLALDRKITVDPGLFDFDLTFQALDESKPNDEYLVAWSGEELEYYYASYPFDSDEVDETDAMWQTFFDEVSRTIGGQQAILLGQGSYFTYDNVPVSYRVYRFTLNGENQVRITHLVMNEEGGSVINIFPASGEIGFDQLNRYLSETMTMLQTVKIGQVANVIR